MTRAIVTGAAGFIGSHLSEKLLDEVEQIAKLTNSKNQTPIFRPGEAD